MGYICVILFKDHKIAFAFPPKTGSTTTKDFLFKSKKCIQLTDKHLIPSVVLNEYQNLNSYKIYSFLRNPLNRFVSAVGFLKQHSKPELNCKKLIETEIYTIETHVIFKKQIEWFKGINVTALDFDNYESELRKVTKNFNLENFEIRHLNKYEGTPLEIDDEVRNFVREYYAADYALAKERLGKEF